MNLTSFHLDAILLGGLAAVVVFCALLLAWQSGRSGGWLRRGGAGPRPFVPDGRAKLRDPAEQLRQVTQSAFFPRKVMNKSEFRIFRIVEAEIRNLGNGCRVLSQTSLGEVIGSEDELAFACINSKRVDILIIGPFGDPLAAIEYQGPAHYQGTAAFRDAVKREALRKAGVRYIEVLDDHSPVEVAGLVRRLFEGVPASPFAAPAGRA